MRCRVARRVCFGQARELESRRVGADLRLGHQFSPFGPLSNLDHNQSRPPHSSPSLRPSLHHPGLNHEHPPAQAQERPGAPATARARASLRLGTLGRSRLGDGFGSVRTSPSARPVQRTTLIVSGNRAVNGSPEEKKAKAALRLPLLSRSVSTKDGVTFDPSVVVNEEGGMRISAVSTTIPDPSTRSGC